jgi:hypothetical protein
MPTHLYKDTDGKRVPSVTTIISRFKESGGLLYWANQAGLDGKTLDEARRPAADAGTMAHLLVEAHIHGQELPELVGEADVIAKAHAAFNAYLRWTKLTNLEIHHTEVPLVSAVHKFGGCLDAIGVAKAMDTGLALIDWKTSNSIWSDYLYQLAAYALLWNENYPDNPIKAGFHLCRFAKEEGDFAHHYFPSLEEEGKTFIMMRELYTRVKQAEKRVR